MRGCPYQPGSKGIAPASATCTDSPIYAARQASIATVWTVCFVSPHTLHPQFPHCVLINFDQLSDVLNCVGGTYETMTGGEVQAVHATYS